MKSLIIRKRIIKIATDLFYQNGYNSTGINEIIEKSNIAKATLYNHFSSKEVLCIAYLKNYNAFFLKSIINYIQEDSVEENKILRLFNFIDFYFESDKFNGSATINLVSELPKNNVKIRDEIKLQQNELFKVIKKAVNDTYISNTERENKSFAEKVYLLFNAALVESHLQQDKNAIVIAKEMCIELIKNR